MSDQKKTQMRLSLSELKLIIIDEVSMVSNRRVLHIHQRLKDIFCSSSSELFAGISVVVVGDFYQLPPIREKPIFENFKNNSYNLYHPWLVFRMVELTEIMRQKDDQHFIRLLNRLRTGSQTEQDINCINSRSISPLAENYPSNTLHIWAENDPVNEHNNKQLEQLSTPLFVLRATDQYPPNATNQNINTILSRGRSETGGLDFEVKIKEGARVMLTTNINIADRLINGQMGTVVKVDGNKVTQKPNVIYVKFDDKRAGTNLIQCSGSPFARQHRVVPIEPVLTKITLRPGKLSSPEVQRIQFPITLTWACTVHKVQGLTLQNVVISFHLNKQKSFNYGQVYVALSRSTSLQGLHILGQINNKHVKANPRVHNEYDRLRRLNTEDIQKNTNTDKERAQDTNSALNIISPKHTLSQETQF
ncbi:ATP-dependent DNA helicase PIF1-like [Montipora capricornis]|uniref:ATP-dependent DNA helicase PIF1-like n=1 Tax=Montipora capricornis TaxID=246305 RepID=UPI0035F1E593